MTQDELRRAPRVKVCCRVDVRQRHGVWTAVTEDLSARGCRVVSSQLPRLGSRLLISLSSDLFPDELSTEGEVVWVSGEQLGIVFLEEAKRAGALSPAGWLQRVLEHGQPPERGAHAVGDRVVPVVRRGAPRNRPAIPIHSRRRSG
jgi:hypothetical protein